MTTFFEDDNNNSEKLQERKNSEKRHYQQSKDKDNGGLIKQNQNALQTNDHLDARYNKVHEEAEGEESSAFLVSHQFSGPIPPPEILRDYEEAEAGSANRLISMAEREQLHRHTMQTKLVDAKLDNTRRFYDERKRGQFCGLIIAAVGIISGTLISLDGKQIAGSCIGAAGIGGIVSVFVLGHGKPKQDDNQARLPPELPPE